MKTTLILLLALTAAITSAQEFKLPDPAQAIWQSVCSADQIFIRNEQPGLDSENTEKDMFWGRRLSLALVLVKMEKPTSCLCTGWRSVFLYSKGKPIGSLAPIHGCKLRIAVSGAHGDYPVDEATWKAVNNLLLEGRNSANNPVDPTTTAVTAPAGQEPRHQ